MAGHSGEWTSPICVENRIHPPHELEKNKFIFVNRNKDPALLKPNTVLINPHFKENKKVYLNPNFQPLKNETTSRPKVHINPNILKCITSTSQPVVTSESYILANPLKPQFSSVKPVTTAPMNQQSVAVIKPRIDNISTMHKPNAFCKINSFDTRKNVSMKSNILNLSHKTQERSILRPTAHQKAAAYMKTNQGCTLPLDPGISGQNQRMVHTRLKIVNNCKTNQGGNISTLKKQKSDVQDKTICSRFKYVRKTGTSPSLNCKQLESPKIKTMNLPKRDSFDNSSVRKNSIITRYKYIRNGAKLVKINKNPLKSKYKIVNNNDTKSLQAKKTKINSSPYRKKYVYLNKYNSSSFLANNVIFKNTKQRNLIKINGILYKNSPCLLKKASLPSKTNLLPAASKGKAPVRQLVKCQGKYKIVRSQLASAAKLKKSNMACPIYKKTGKCNGQKTGSCIRIHNPDQIILCKRFLQGVCRNNNCLLSHKVSSEKMPTCKYFLEGLCNKTECQYSHVKISPNAEICRDFLEGFCKEGLECDKRHQFLCPEYEKTKKCSKPKCEYPHGTSELIKSKPERKILRKIIPKKTVKKITQQTTQETSQTRYYKENSDEVKETETSLKRTMEEEVIVPKRQKLGSLPSFIPIL